jgi:hypothetical protein
MYGGLMEYDHAVIVAKRRADRLRRPMVVRRNRLFGGYAVAIECHDTQGERIVPGYPLSAEQVRIAATIAEEA